MCHNHGNHDLLIKLLSKLIHANVSGSIDNYKLSVSRNFKDAKRDFSNSELMLILSKITRRLIHLS